MMTPAPIVLFVYNRPIHTKQTVECLRKNILAAQSDLIVYADGPKNDKSVKAVTEVREYIKSISGFKSLTIIESQQNQGLANSIIKGVSEVIEKYGQIIVVEDDLLTSPYFLTYMNDALELYKDEDDVISIHGYMYPVRETLPETFFIKGADCWGWATWAKGWCHFNRNSVELLNEIHSRGLEKQFDFEGAFPYTNMLQKQVNGAIDSWAIRWYASAFLKNKLTLYPNKSLVYNIGNDGSGTHSGTYDFFDVSAIDKITVTLNKIPIQENANARKIMAMFLKGSNPKSFVNLFRRIKSLFLRRKKTES